MLRGVTVPMLRSANAAPPLRKVKTTLELPEELWRAAKIRAMDERTDLRTVLIAALEAYLKLTKHR
jgi:hypothetical protein